MSAFKVTSSLLGVSQPQAQCHFICKASGTLIYGGTCSNLTLGFRLSPLTHSPVTAHLLVETCVSDCRLQTAPLHRAYAMAQSHEKTH